MEKRIEIKGAGEEELSQQYFEDLLAKYRVKGATVEYEPKGNPSGSRRRGVVTVTGDFNVSDIYSILSKKFIITKIDGIDLEKLIGEK